MYSVGVGSRINEEELGAIASSEENVRQLDGFDVTEFAGLRSRITTEACLGESRAFGINSITPPPPPNLESVL